MPTLSRNVQRIVIRQGLQADIPALISAEMGWDTDKKVLRVGDNSTSPVKIMTNKSTDSFDFTSVPLIKFGKVEFASGATVGGIDLSTLNSSAGIIVRSAVSGVFSRTQVVSGDGSISVIGGDGLSGNIDVRVDPSLISAIAAAQTATVTAAATAPITSKLGDIWYNTGNGITYLRITDGVTSTWKDIITDPNAATGANLSYGSTAPTSPSLGDMWFNTSDEVLYVRTNDGTSDLWLDVSSTGSGGGVSITSSVTAPASPTSGTMWYNTADEILYIYVNTGTSSTWLDISTVGTTTGGSGSTSAANTISGSGAPAAGTGSDGDYYINASTAELFGPKASGAWPSSATSTLGSSSRTPAQALATLTNYGFTGIPSGVKHIEVHYYDVRWGPASGGYTIVGVQLGTSGGYVTTGYKSSAGGSGDSVATWNFFTDCLATGAYCHPNPGTITGVLYLDMIGSNIWKASGLHVATNGSNNTYAAESLASGFVTLSGTLTSLKFMNTVGRTFDSGNVWLVYS